MEFAIPNQTLTDDLLHQQNRLCDAVRYSIQEDKDMVIISQDKQLLPCHSSLLVLFSPLIARVLCEVPCCVSPTIILPEIPALHIRKLLHLLESGQTTPGKNMNADIKIIKEIAQVLQISITDLRIEHSLGNLLGDPTEMKQEVNSSNVKQEISLVEEKKVEASRVKQEMNSANIKEETISIKEEPIEQCEYIEDVTENIPKQEYVVESLHNKNYFVEQCGYIEQDITVKIPQQDYMMPSMEEVMRMDALHPTEEEFVMRIDPFPLMEEAVEINSLPSIGDELGAYAINLEGCHVLATEVDMHNNQTNPCILNHGNARKRRNECKKGFETLKEVVPELAKFPKPSKLKILKKSKKYIHLLQKEHTQQRKEIMMEVKRNKTLKMMLMKEVNKGY